MGVCEHPTCAERSPHYHMFSSAQCIEGKHSKCKGGYTSERPDVLTEEELTQRHAAENADLKARGIDMGDSEYWRVSDRQKQEWHAFIEVRDGKRKSRMVGKVWTCRCKCHGGNGNGRLPKASEVMPVSGGLRLARILEATNA